MFKRVKWHDLRYKKRIKRASAKITLRFIIYLYVYLSFSLSIHLSLYLFLIASERENDRGIDEACATTAKEKVKGDNGKTGR